MGRTRIFLDSSGDIEMYDDVSTPLNYSIADIRNPDKRNSNYSKTIRVPGTHSNNLLFGNIFDVNITNGAFNPNSKVKATLIIDDEEQINGYLQMLNIIINDDSKIEYELSIIGNVGTIFSALGNSELTDLSYVIYNHTYDYPTQVASWTNTHNEGYVYPHIDYGFDDDLSKVNVEHLFPSLFLRTYIDKIFASAGYTYSSTFFDSTFFKKLIVPTNSGKAILTDAQISPRLFEATQTSQSSGTIYSTPSGSGFYNVTFNQMDVIYNNEITDVSNQYNPATGVWTIDKAGYYNLAANGSATVTASPAMNCFLKIERYPISGFAYTPIFQTTQSVGIGTSTIYVGGSNVFLDAGDKIKITLSSSTITSPILIAGTITFNGGTFKNTVVNSGILEGDPITVSQVVPNKIKQKDLFLSVIKMFNLYIDVDKNNDRNLLIETRDDFYSSGTNLDWSSKLDNSKPIEYRPMGDLDFKEFNYTYTDDTDYFNKKYKGQYNETYGRYRHVTENEFLSGVSETKVIFSPTPLVGDNGSNRIISRIWEVDSANVVKSKAFNIRILYLGGVLTSNVPYDYQGRFTGSHIVTQYLYAGHVDSPTAPTLDLSFGVPQEIYYYTTQYTNNNLFNSYYKKFVDEITDRDSKIVTAYFYLRPSDVRTLDFRNQFFFDNEYFRLNKIYDYDPLRHETTKCEFVKIKDAGTFTSTIHSMLGGYSSALANEFAPVMSNPSASTYSNIYTGGAARSMNAGEDNIYDDNVRECIVQGNGNVIGNSTGVTLVGSSGNIIGSGCKNISIINSSGDTITGGLKNVTLINTHNVTVTSGDIVYINGSVYSVGGGGVTGSGTLNRVAKWTPSGTALGNSVLRDDGASVYNLGAGAIATDTAFGDGALIANTTGDANTGIGYNALKANTIGQKNTAIGYLSQLLASLVDYNTSLGAETLHFNTGAGNTAVGYYSQATKTTGDYNSTYGYQSLPNSTGSFNNALGGFALYDATSGNYNTIVGYNTARGIVTGGSNTIIGSQVSGLGAALSNNIILSDGAGTIRLQFDNAGVLTINGLAVSGTYTPTLTNVANVAASTAYQCQWLRQGNTVTVSGKVDIDPTLTATSTQLGISLPVASNFANDYECGGTASSATIAGMSGGIFGDATNNRAQLQFLASDINNSSLYFTFTYTVI